MGCIMKRLYNFKLDIELIKAIDKLNGPRTMHIANALQLYLHDNNHHVNNEDLVELLKKQIIELNRDKEYLLNRINTLMLAKYFIKN